MATITITTTSVKPAGKQWFNASESAKNAAYIAWARTFPGVTSFTGGAVDTNTWRAVTVFESQTARDAFQVACQLNENWLARNVFNEANGITSTRVQS